MKIVNVPIDAIRPYEKNPRHNEEAVEKVARSIEEFGFVQPIVVDKESVIIIGHTRRLAAMKLGMVEVPVLIASDLSEENVMALRLIDNKTGEISLWDTELLNKEIEELKEFDIEYDLEEFGFEKLIEDVFSEEDFDDEPENDNLFDEEPHKPMKLTPLKIEFETTEEKAEAFNKLGITVEMDFTSWNRLKEFLK